MRAASNGQNQSLKKSVTIAVLFLALLHCTTMRVPFRAMARPDGVNKSMPVADRPACARHR
jgi:hypothetical protein